MLDLTSFRLIEDSHLVNKLDAVLNIQALYALSGGNVKLRRGRENVIMHYTRVALGVEERLFRVALLHDIVEDNPKYTIDYIAHLYGLEDYEIKVMELLTRKKRGESSREHFDRILHSNNTDAYKVKISDLMDNAIFTKEDHVFTSEVLNLNPTEEINKYLQRAIELKQKLYNLRIL